MDFGVGVDCLADLDQGGRLEDLRREEVLRTLVLCQVHFWEKTTYCDYKRVRRRRRLDERR